MLPELIFFPLTRVEMGTETNAFEIIWLCHVCIRAASHYGRRSRGHWFSLTLPNPMVFIIVVVYICAQCEHIDSRPCGDMQIQSLFVIYCFYNISHVTIFLLHLYSNSSLIVTKHNAFVCNYFVVYDGYGCFVYDHWLALLFVGYGTPTTSTCTRGGRGDILRQHGLCQVGGATRDEACVYRVEAGVHPLPLTGCRKGHGWLVVFVM